MRKGCDGGKKAGGKGGDGGTGKKEKTDDYGGHYVIASSQMPTAGMPNARAN